jgi:hypothetical protein
MKKSSLFPEGRYNSMNVYHKASRKTDSGGQYLLFIETAVLVIIAYLLWITLHESMHYLSCELFGGHPSLFSLVPTPTVGCAIPSTWSLSESFFYTMSPYLLGVLVLAAVFGSGRRFMKYLAYAAFFDLVYNLFVTTIFYQILWAKENDLIYLIRNLFLSNASSYMVLFYEAMVSLIILLAFTLFYGGGYVRIMQEEKYRNAVIILVLIYAGNILNLYLTRAL